MSLYTPMTAKDIEKSQMSPLTPPKNKNLWQSARNLNKPTKTPYKSPEVIEEVAKSSSFKTELSEESVSAATVRSSDNKNSDDGQGGKKQSKKPYMFTK